MNLCEQLSNSGGEGVGYLDLGTKVNYGTFIRKIAIKCFKANKNRWV